MKMSDLNEQMIVLKPWANKRGEVMEVKPIK